MEKTVAEWVQEIESSTGPERERLRNQAWGWALDAGRVSRLAQELRRVAAVRQVECHTETCYCSHCRGW